MTKRSDIYGESYKPMSEEQKETKARIGESIREQRSRGQRIQELGQQIKKIMAENEKLRTQNRRLEEEKQRLETLLRKRR